MDKEYYILLEKVRMERAMEHLARGLSKDSPSGAD